MTEYYGDRPHQIVLIQHSNTLTRVQCTCDAQLGIVPVTSGTGPCLDLFRQHKGTVVNR
jgi:hypothetical protein